MEDPRSLLKVNTIGNGGTFKVEGYNLKLFLVLDGTVTAIILYEGSDI